MKEYTILAIISVFVVWRLDRQLKTQLFVRQKFWHLQLITMALTLLVEGIANSKPVVFFNENMILGLRIVNIPLENFFFGFSLISLNLILFERWKSKS